MKTRVLSFVLVLCMVFALLPGAALAADEQPAQLVKLEAEGGHLILDAENGTIVGCEKTVTSAVIPASVELKGEAEEGEEPVVTTVEIAAVGEKAFAGCTELKEVYFEGNLEIAADAFKGVTATAYFPAFAKDSWDKTANYGGKLTWDQWCPEHEIELAHIDKEPTCTENGLKTGVCSYCGEVATVEITALGHDFDDWTTTTEPTCTAAGEKMHQCTRCKLIEVQAIEATGHSEETEWTIDKEATCTEEGLRSGHCPDCDADVTEVIPMTEHNYGERKVVKEPTCTEAGEQQRVCADCKAVESEEIKATGHDWKVMDSVSKDATCTEDGRLVRTCTVCGAHEDEVIPALGHTPADDRVGEKPATCTEDGYTGDVVCSVCKDEDGNAFVIEEGEVIPALGHKVSENAKWTVTKEPTCGEVGVETCNEKCSVCGQTVTRDIPKTEHSVKAWVVFKPATCTEDGRRIGRCSVCNEYVEEVIPALGHKTEVVDAKDATCTEAGYTGDVVCTVCEEVIAKGEAIPALGHKTEVVGAKDATCTEAGYTGDVVCAVCEEVIEKGEAIPALGHKTEVVDAKDATCTEAGYTGDVVCTVCEEVIEKGEVIPALGHKTEVVGAKDATCTEAGYTGDEVCTVCKEVVKKGETVAALGHDYKDGVCTVCGEKDPNYKPAIKFTDVDTEGRHLPFADAIQWAAAEGITTGYGDGIFAPDKNCSRAQVVTFLWRAAGEPEPKSAENPFVDVSAKQADGKDNPYYTAILWAVGEGITNGVDSTHFAPDATVTRAQFVTFLWRYENKPAAKPGIALKDIDTVTNADFKAAILWAAGEEITTGYSDGTFRPNAACTRAHVVTFIYRDMT